MWCHRIDQLNFRMKLQGHKNRDQIQTVNEIDRTIASRNVASTAKAINGMPIAADQTAGSNYGQLLAKPRTQTIFHLCKPMASRCYGQSLGRLCDPTCLGTVDAS